MFWKWKKDRPRAESHDRAADPVEHPKSDEERLKAATKVLLASLQSYSEAAHNAYKPKPDAELTAAYQKVAAANKLVRDSGLGQALGSRIPEHIMHWPSWSQREDFARSVGFDAVGIVAKKHKQQHGSREDDVVTIDFMFNRSQYSLIFRIKGRLALPGSEFRDGEVELFVGDQRVAVFSLSNDISKEYSVWTFSDVRAIKVGDWMKDIIDIAAQIEASGEKEIDDYQDKKIMDAAREIDLG